MSSGSDIEIHTSLPKKIKKLPKSHLSPVEIKDSEPKKLSTKDMIHEALQVLHTRKGVSLYAIKKYITEKYNIDTAKLNYLIKKTIKNELEIGNIVQTKGVGVTGSFRLAPKKKIEKPIKKKQPKTKKTVATDKVKKPKKELTEEPQKEVKKVIKKKKEAEKITKAEKSKKSEKTMKKSKKDKATKEKKGSDVKKVKTKMAKETHTPAKKRAAMLKRKSIGSIIKPPKMKPKAR